MEWRVAFAICCLGLFMPAPGGATSPRRGSNAVVQVTSDGSIVEDPPEDESGAPQSATVRSVVSASSASLPGSNLRTDDFTSAWLLHEANQSVEPPEKSNSAVLRTEEQMPTVSAEEEPPAPTRAYRGRLMPTKTDAGVEVEQGEAPAMSAEEVSPASSITVATSAKMDRPSPVSPEISAPRVSSPPSASFSLHRVSQSAPSAPVKYVQTIKSMSGGAYYLMSLCFGKKRKQCFDGIPDTGSFEIVVRSRKCEDKGCVEPFYDNRLSDSYKKDPKKTDIVLTYGSGPVKAKGGYDTVCVGPNCDVDQFFLQTEVSGVQGLADGPIIGIFGIGRGDAEGRSERLLAKMDIDIYSVCLARNEQHDGQIVWKDESPDTNPKFREIPIFGQVHWAAQLTKMQLGMRDGTKLPLACENGCGAILDSGTTFITPPPEMVKHLAQYMKDKSIDCHDVSKLPHLEFKFGDATYRLPPAAYVTIVEENVPNWLETKLHFKPNTRGHSTCMFLFIQPMGQETQKGPAMIMGMPFFRYYYTTFNWKEGKVWAAPHTQCVAGEEQVDSEDLPMRMDFQKLLPRDRHYMDVV